MLVKVGVWELTDQELDDGGAATAEVVATGSILSLLTDENGCAYLGPWRSRLDES